MGVSARYLRDRDLPGGQYYRSSLAPSIYPGLGKIGFLRSQKCGH